MSKKITTTKTAKTAKAAKTAKPATSDKGAAIPQAMSPEAVSAVTKSRGKAVKAAKGAVAAKLAAQKSTASAALKTMKEAIDGKLIGKTLDKLAAAPEPKVRTPKPLAPEVVELIALLKTKKGTTNEEAAEALKLKAKGKAAHQTPAAQVRGMIRDKVRPLHTVTAEHDPERSGVVYRIS